MNDALHDGVVVPDLRKMLHGKASEGGFWTPQRVVVAALVAVVVWAVLRRGDRGDRGPVEEDEADA